MQGRRWPQTKRLIWYHGRNAIPPSESAPVSFHYSMPETFSFRDPHSLLNQHSANSVKCLPWAMPPGLQPYPFYAPVPPVQVLPRPPYFAPDSKQDPNWPVPPSPPPSSLPFPSPFLPMLPNFSQSTALIKMFPAQKLPWLSTMNLNLNCLA